RCRFAATVLELGAGCGDPTALGTDPRLRPVATTGSQALVRSEETLDARARSRSPLYVDPSRGGPRGRSAKRGVREGRAFDPLREVHAGQRAGGHPLRRP